MGVAFAPHDVILKALDTNAATIVVGKRGIESEVVLILAHPDTPREGAKEQKMIWKCTSLLDVFRRLREDSCILGRLLALTAGRAFGSIKWP